MSMMGMSVARVRVLCCLRLGLMLAAVLFGTRNGEAQINSSYVAYGVGGSGAAYPVAGLLLASDGNYWGTTTLGGTNGRGTIFSMTPAGVITVAYSFNGTDGEQPRSPLVENVDGTLFGTAAVGGTFGAGTAFRFDRNTGVLTPLHSFAGDSTEGAGPNGIMQASDGNFYGTTQRAIFKITSPPTLAYSVLHTFNSTTEGYSPLNNVVEGSNGLLYGSIYGLGGTPNQDLARIYSIPKTGGSLQILYHASRADGFASNTLIQGNDGALYGTARDGGAFWNTTGCIAVGNCGTVYRFDLTTNTYTVLFSFDGGSDGRDPEGGLAQGADGLLYGTTAAGGSLGGGTIFRIGTSGGLTTIHQFDGTNGYSPRGELIEPSAGVFYGTTFGGSSNGYGAAYRLTLCAADVSTVASVASQGPLKLNRKTGRYTQAVTLKNGDGAMAGPVSLVLDGLSSDTALFNATGATTCAAPFNSPYINVDVGTDSVFNSRERATVTLEFTSSSGQPPTYTGTRVLAGTGNR
jgi:uncharacterized repeat protein (TIGR03803 family)